MKNINEINEAVLNLLNSMEIVKEQEVAISKIEFIEEDKLLLEIHLSNMNSKNELKDALIKLIKIDLAVPKLKIDFEEIFTNDFTNTKFIVVASGKGGVGKSTVSANLANMLNKQGFKVGIIDADIYGSSIPLVFGLTHTPEVEAGKIIPIQYENVSLIGTSSLNPSGEPLVWRGPMLNRMLNSFFKDVKWGEIDYMVIDLPPGTGDVALDINNHAPNSKVLIVTTPSINASEVAIKAGQMAILQNQELLGVVENMSYLIHKNERIDVFGIGGGEHVSKALNTSLLTQIPLAQSTSHASLFSKDEEVGLIYFDLAKKIVNNFY